LNSDSLFGGASDPNASPTVVVAAAFLELHVMHVILFGAGASYGSGAVHPEPPPLGDQLFDLLTRAFPASWGALPNDHQARFRESFELGMGALLATGSHAVPPMMQEFAILFSRYQSRPGNAYSLLVESLDEAGKIDRTAYASLNYECLLEWALMMYHQPVAYFGPKRGFTDVWKLHGSCNFLPTGLSVAPARTGVTYGGSGVKIGAGIEPVEPSTVPSHLRDTGLYPAMAHYAPGKEVQISEHSIQKVQDLYAAAVAAAESVGVIGVRPNVEDGHVWAPLAETPARILYVGGRDAYNDWRRSHRGNRPTEHLGDRFSEAIAPLVDAL